VCLPVQLSQKSLGVSGYNRTGAYRTTGARPLPLPVRKRCLPAMQCRLPGRPRKNREKRLQLLPGCYTLVSEANITTSTKDRMQERWPR
jgi:hypothetical protein